MLFILEERGMLCLVFFMRSCYDNPSHENMYEVGEVKGKEEPQ